MFSLYVVFVVGYKHHICLMLINILYYMCIFAPKIFSLALIINNLLKRLTMVLLNLDHCLALANSVDADQLASQKPTDLALQCLSLSI